MEPSRYIKPDLPNANDDRNAKAAISNDSKLLHADHLRALEEYKLRAYYAHIVACIFCVLKMNNMFPGKPVYRNANFISTKYQDLNHS